MKATFTLEMETKLFLSLYEQRSNDRDFSQIRIGHFVKIFDTFSPRGIMYDPDYYLRLLLILFLFSGKICIEEIIAAFKRIGVAIQHDEATQLLKR